LKKKESTTKRKKKRARKERRKERKKEGENMRLKDLNKGQRLLIKLAKDGKMPVRLSDQVQAAIDGKINPLLNEDGSRQRITIIDDTYDGPEDKTIDIELNPDNTMGRVMGFFVDKFGTFGGIYFECLQMFDQYPKKKAEAKFRYFLGLFSKENGWYRPGDFKKNIRDYWKPKGEGK